MTGSSADNVRTKLYQSEKMGRKLRFLLGAWLIVLVVPYWRAASGSSILTTLAIILGLLVLYIFVHIGLLKYLPGLNRWFGALLAWVPVMLVFVLGGAHGRVGVSTFASLSLILAGVRGDPGCEVMSIPALIFKKHTHLLCILFSPIDWLEAKIFRKGPA